MPRARSGGSGTAAAATGRAMEGQGAGACRGGGAGGVAAPRLLIQRQRTSRVQERRQEGREVGSKAAARMGHTSGCTVTGAAGHDNGVWVVGREGDAGWLVSLAGWRAGALGCRGGPRWRVAAAAVGGRGGGTASAEWTACAGWGRTEPQPLVPFWNSERARCMVVVCLAWWTRRCLAAASAAVEASAAPLRRAKPLPNDLLLAASRP